MADKVAGSVGDRPERLVKQNQAPGPAGNMLLVDGLDHEFDQPASQGPPSTLHSPPSSPMPSSFSCRHCSSPCPGMCATPSCMATWIFWPVDGTIWWWLASYALAISWLRPAWAAS